MKVEIFIILKCTILGITFSVLSADSSLVLPTSFFDPKSASDVFLRDQSLDSNSPPTSTQLSSSASQKHTDVAKGHHRINVVKENPSLDVGPLIEVTVAEGDSARLPCANQPLNADDSAQLILWYRNDTTRPFLSFDSRSNSITTAGSDSGSPLSLIESRNKFSGGKTRTSLSKDGSSLVIKGAQFADQAEYRCKVHYSHSPSSASRLKLIVTSSVRRIQLLDAEGRSVGDHVGPLSEESHLSLTCRAKCDGELVSLEWLVDGKPIASSWTRTASNFILSNLQLPLKRDHAHATLTCRLNCRNAEADKGITASIVDVSTTILMYYVPQATLIIDSASSDGMQTADGPQGRVTFRVTEGMTVSFICAVKSRPPPYNISWMHNGRIIGSGNRRWTKHNSSLVVSPVKKDDSGLYTCLASNTEGDGQSNAVIIRVAHAPYCAGPPRRQVMITKGSNVTISCEVEAEPANVTFTWNFDPPGTSARQSSGPSSNMQIYAPNSNSKEKLNKTDQVTPHPIFHTDPENSRKSVLMLTKESGAIEGVVCFAKNQVGRMQVPCAFSLTFVDPPRSPKECNVTVLSWSQVQVTCAPEHEESEGKDIPLRTSPGLGYVLSPEAKTLSHLEVWDTHSLLFNLSGEKPSWLVSDLPPDTNLLLRLYSTSSHSKSDPVILHTRTRTRPFSVKAELPEGKPSVSEEGPNVNSVADKTTDPESSILGVLSLIFSLVGGIGAMLALLILSIYFLKRRGRRRQLGVPNLAREPSPPLEVCISTIKADVDQTEESRMKDTNA